MSDPKVEEQLARMTQVQEELESGRRCQSCCRWLGKPTKEIDCQVCRAEDLEWATQPSHPDTRQP